MAKTDRNLKLDHAVDFTNREIKTLIGWLVAANAGATGTAGRILATGLLAEHYESLLPDDPAERSAEELTILGSLNIEADTALDQVRALMPATPVAPYGGTR